MLPPQRDNQRQQPLERFHAADDLSAVVEITHGNHPRLSCVARIFQCLAVPRQPLKLLETLESGVLKSRKSGNSGISVQCRSFNDLPKSLCGIAHRITHGNHPILSVLTPEAQLAIRRATGAD